MDSSTLIDVTIIKPSWKSKFSKIFIFLTTLSVFIVMIISLTNTYDKTKMMNCIFSNLALFTVSFITYHIYKNDKVVTTIKK